MDCHTEDVTIKMEPPLEISDSDSDTESGSETLPVIQNNSYCRKRLESIHESSESPGMVIETTTYNTSMYMNMEKDTSVFGNFVGGEPGRNLTWEQARFIDFMSSHILQLSMPLQNEFLDGVMGLYLEISKRNH